MRALTIATALILLAAAGAACSGDSAPARADVVRSLTDQLIVPAYEDAASRLSALHEAIDGYCTTGAPTLEEVRERWRAARLAWAHTAAFRQGPAMDRRSASLIDWWPVRPDRIEEALAERAAITAGDVVDFFPATQRGLGAVELVLFGPGAPALAASGDAIGCQFLRAVSDVAATEAAAVATAWSDGTDGAGSFADRFTGSSAGGMDAFEAVTELVRGQAFLITTIADMELGRGLGIDRPRANLGSLVEGAAVHGVADLLAKLAGAEQVYLGIDDPGLSAIIADLSGAADERVRAAFSAAREAVAAVPPPLHDAATAADPTLFEAHETLKALQRTINTEVVSLLGISLGFSDNDGDS